LSDSHALTTSQKQLVKLPRCKETHNQLFLIILGSRKRRPKEEWFHVAVPAIVSPDLFHKVQAQLEKNKRINTRNNSVINTS
jgi:hypothetical protein